MKIWSQIKLTRNMVTEKDFIHLEFFNTSIQIS